MGKAARPDPLGSSKKTATQDGSGKRAKKSLFEIDASAPVVVFDQTKFGIKPWGGPSASLPPRTATLQDVVPPTQSRSQDPDDIADMEASQLWDRLKNTVDDIHASELKGRDRKKYTIEKVVRLGGVPPKKQHHPTDIRIGQRVKQRDRAKKTAEMARSMDLVLPRAPGSKDKGSKSKRRK